jgi:hypothetical protein
VKRVRKEETGMEDVEKDVLSPDSPKPQNPLDGPL